MPRLVIPYSLRADAWDFLNTPIWELFPPRDPLLRYAVWAPIGLTLIAAAMVRANDPTRADLARLAAFAVVVYLVGLWAVARGRSS